MVASPSDAGTATDLTDGSPYAEGTVVDIEATPETGYEFQRWTTDPDGVGAFDDAFDPNTTFTMPDQDVTVIANFLDFEGRDKDVSDWNVTQSGAVGITIDTWDISEVGFSTGDTIDFLFTAYGVPDRFTVWYGDDLIFESGWVSNNPGGYTDPPYTGGIQEHYWHVDVEFFSGAEPELPADGGIYEAMIVYDGTNEITVRAEGIETGTAWAYRLRTTP